MLFGLVEWQRVSSTSWKTGLEEKFLSKGPETKKKKKPLCCAPHFRARTNLFQCAAL